VAPVLVAAVFLIGGHAINLLLGQASFFEQRAFRLTFSVCILVAGASQYYQTQLFGTALSTSDSETFFYAINGGVNLSSFDEIKLTVDSPLSVSIWQFVYHYSSYVIQDGGVWLAVFVNAAAVGLAATFTVRCCHELFGDDERRLRFVGTLCALCGNFWLFGGLLLRDCFAMLAMTVCLWACVRCITRRGVYPKLAAFAVTAVAGMAMYYVRQEAIYAVGFFGLLAAGFSVWTFHDQVLKVVVLCGVFAASLLCVGLLINQLQEVQELHSQRHDDYARMSDESATTGSLGMAYVVNQPLPIRLVLGSLVLLAYPIPIWDSLTADVAAYDVIKNCHGVFMIFVVPLGLTGSMLAILNAMRGKGEYLPLLFITLAAGSSLAMIALTSLETRHYGQFLPAFLLLAAAPGAGVQHRRLLGRTRIGWLLTIYAIHIAWLYLKLRS